MLFDPKAGDPKTGDPKAGGHAKTAETRLPGDLEPQDLVARMIRVDQAGELGAVRIYQGQLAVLRNHPSTPMIEHMAEQERHHLATFDRLIGDREVRPTALSPLWTVAGFALGAATALLGEQAAMACTAAVEEVIDQHYSRQLEQLGEDESALKDTIERFRREEVEHRDTALAHGAEEAPAYPLLTSLIKSGCRTAIWLAERI